MKTILKLLKLTIILALTSSAAFAGKIDLMAGMYSYKAEVGNKATSLSGLGTYEAAYMHSFYENFEINVGYSFTMTGIISGDYSFGPKIGFNYYPFNFSSNEKIKIADTVLTIRDFYKPYIGLAFNQRQFQSARTSYAGFGLSVGCEKYINPKYTVKGEIKMNSYTGASDATATEMNLLLGIVFDL